MNVSGKNGTIEGGDGREMKSDGIVRKNYIMDDVWIVVSLLLFLIVVGSGVKHV